MSRAPSVPVRVRVQRLPHAQGLPLPAYQSAQAAGLDLIAAVPEKKPLKLKPGGRLLVPTGLVLELPSGTEAQVRPRSGLAFKHGVTVLNAPGTIDSDYRGELQVLLVNLGDEPFLIRRGERIAQLVIQTVARARLLEVDAVVPTKRGDGGFGSTGVGQTAMVQSGLVQAGKTLTTAGPARRRPAIKKASVISVARGKGHGRSPRRR